MLLRTAVAVASSCAVLVLSSRGFTTDLPGKGITVQPGHVVGVLEDLFQTEVVNIAMERLGYDVRPAIEMDVPVLHVAVAQGDVDYVADHWDPLQQAFIEQAGGPDKLTLVGDLLKGCAQGYLIDKKTYDTLQITNLEQLKDPKIAMIFDSEGTGKAQLNGCPPGWGCERVIEHHLDTYGLRDTVTHQQGQFNVLKADVIAKIKAGKPILYYTYAPLWLNSVLVPGRDVEWLEVPFVSLPEGDQTVDTKNAEGKNVGFPINTQRIMASPHFLESNPAAKRLFELASIPVEDVNAQNWKIHEGENALSDIRRHAEEWVTAHQAEVDRWIQEAINAAK
ncbi:MAG: glycine betaine/L-proline ABC transporter substrate-binding protein ProX [Dongiaceae bacterium]